MPTKKTQVQQCFSLLSALCLSDAAGLHLGRGMDQLQSWGQKKGLFIADRWVQVTRQGEQGESCSPLLSTQKEAYQSTEQVILCM